MRYVICEDSGSGYQFFNDLTFCFGVSSECRVISSNGNMNFYDTLVNVLPFIVKGDKLLLAFDYIGISDRFDPNEIIEYAIRYCTNVGAEYYWTTYFCFEELYLSYIRLHDMFWSSRNASTDWLDALDYICERINSGVNYFDLNHPSIKFIISQASYANRGREKCAKAVLYNITRKLLGQFTISDGNFGRCWLHTCGTFDFSNIRVACTKCVLCNHCRESYDKAIDLEGNTISQFKSFFSKFFT